MLSAKAAGTHQSKGAALLQPDPPQRRPQHGYDHCAEQLRGRRPLWQPLPQAPMSARGDTKEASQLEGARAASARPQLGAARKEAGARGRGEVSAWLPGAREEVGKEHAGPGVCMGTAELLPLTRGRKHGSCTAACPSWSKMSSLPDWSGRSGEESTGRVLRVLSRPPASPPMLSPSHPPCNPAQMSGSSRLRAIKTEPGGENLMAACSPCETQLTAGRHMAHRTDEASVMPAEAQCLQEPVPSIDLEVTATALGAKHLLIVCEHRQSTGQWFLQDCNPSFRCSRAAAQPGDNLLPALERGRT